MAVLLLLLSLPQVDQAQHQREKDDDQGPEQERHHHALSVRLVAQRRALPAPRLSLVLDAAPTPLEAGAEATLMTLRPRRGHHCHTGLGYEQLAQQRLVVYAVLPGLAELVAVRTVGLHPQRPRVAVEAAALAPVLPLHSVSIMDNFAQQRTRISHFPVNTDHSAKPITFKGDKRVNSPFHHHWILKYFILCSSMVGNNKYSIS